MSEIRRARELLGEAAALLQEALSLMTREPPVKRTKSKRIKITPELRKQVKELAAMGLSHHDIANITGTYNIGRVSEILRKKR